MIDSESTLTRDEILRKRAEKYAALPDVRSDRGIVNSIVILRVGAQLLGIPSKSLELIGKTPPIAHLPGLPRLVRGALQNRGELMAAVDIARWFGIETEGRNEFFAVFVHHTGRKLALLVDEVIGFRDVGEDDLVESFLGNRGQNRHPVSGTTRDLMAIIDVNTVFESPEIAAGPNIGKQEN